MKKFTLFVATIMASAAMLAEVTVEKLVQVTPDSPVYALLPRMVRMPAMRLLLIMRLKLFCRSIFR